MPLPSKHKRILSCNCNSVRTHPQQVLIRLFVLQTARLITVYLIADIPICILDYTHCSEPGMRSETDAGLSISPIHYSYPVPSIWNAVVNKQINYNIPSCRRSVGDIFCQCPGAPERAVAVHSGLSAAISQFAES